MAAPWEADAIVSKSAPWDNDDLVEEKPGMLRRAGGALLDAAVWTGEQIDRFTGAPARAGISAMQKTQNEANPPKDGDTLGNFMRSTIPDLTSSASWRGMGAGLLAAKNQFGKDPSKAPTGKDIAIQGGIPQTAVSDVLPSFYSESGKGLPLKKGGLLDPSAAGAAGLGVDVLADPSNVVGLGQMKTGLRMVGEGGKIAAKTTAKAADIIGGTDRFTETVQGLGKGYDDLKAGLGSVFGAKQADDFQQSVEVAKRNGIDPGVLPAAVEFGPSSFVTRAERVKAEGPLGQNLMDKHKEGLQQVQQAVVRDIETLAGGVPPSSAEAGEILRKGFETGADRFFDEIETTYDSVIAQNPGLKISPKTKTALMDKLDKLQEFASDRIENGITATQEAQGKQLIKAVDKVRKNVWKGQGETETFQGAVKALRDIGEIAFKNKNSMADIPPDIQRFRSLYGDLSETLLKSVEDGIGPEVAAGLRENNKAMSQFFKDQEWLSKLGDTGVAPEKVFQSLIEQGDSKRIAALKKYLAPEEMSAVKGAFLKNLIKENAEGEFTFKSLGNALRQKKAVTAALFGKGELENINDLIRLGDRFGNVVMSTSGTGASNAFREFLTRTRDAAIDEPIASSIKERARAIGFRAEDAPSRAAASDPRTPPTMGNLPQFGESSGGALARRIKAMPRRKPLQVYSVQSQEDDE